MFQYATGRALANRLGTSLKLDLTSYSHDLTRSYELNLYPIQAKRAGPLSRVFFKLVSSGLSGVSHFCETGPSVYDAAFELLSGNVFLDGYFQNARYFESYADSLREDLRWRQRLSKAGDEFLRQIKDVNAVSMHVRCGDYLSDPKVHEFLPHCGSSFFARAADRMVQQLEDPTFFVFSDDLEWVSQNLDLPYPTALVSADNAHEDLHLMSQCRHHIIPNSTFSWWAAWLNPNPDKIVVGPEPWFHIEECPSGPMLPDWQVVSR